MYQSTNLPILLVEPPKTPWEMMGDMVAPPLGLATLAGMLERESIPVQILDANALGLDWSGLRRAIAEAAPDRSAERSRRSLVGVTAFTCFFPHVARVAQIAKAVNPEVITVAGGPHVTFTAEESLTSTPELDFVVRGEGDQILVNLIRCLEGGGELGEVEGIAFRRDGAVVQTPDPPPLDLRALPLAAFHLLPMEQYRFEGLGGSFATLIASRGCPHRCVFCAEWPFWRDGWRARDPEAVVEELEIVSRRYGRKHIWFGDDCFNVSGSHLQAICESILRRGLEVEWYYQGRTDLLIKHRELLPLMRRAGNRMVQLGIEAASDEEMRELCKRQSVEQVKEAVALLRQHDIVCQGMFIIGTPTDAPRSIRRKVAFAKRLDVDFPVFTFYTPFPGSGTWEQARAAGWVEDPPDWTKYDMAHPLMPTERMSRRELAHWYVWCFTSYYFDPLKLARGLLARNDWKRRIWWRMTAFGLKSLMKAL